MVNTEQIKKYGSLNEIERVIYKIQERGYEDSNKKEHEWDFFSDAGLNDEVIFDKFSISSNITDNERKTFFNLKQEDQYKFIDNARQCFCEKNGKYSEYLLMKQREELEKNNLIVPEEIKNIEEFIQNNSVSKLKRMKDKILIDISNIDDEVTQTYFIRMLAEKTKLVYKSLYKKIIELKDEYKVRVTTSVSDLLGMNVPEVDYYIENLIPKGCLILFGGKPGQAKSLTTQHMFLSLFTDSYLDKFKVNNNNNNIKLLVYDLENNLEHVLAPRLQYIAKGLGLTQDDLKDKFDVYADFNKNNMKFELERTKDFDIIIFDSYKRFLRGTENDSTVTDKFYQEFLKPLTDAGKTIVIIHHFKKSNMEDLSEEFLLDLFRGSSDIASQIDLGFGVFRTPEIISDDCKTTRFETFITKIKNRRGLPVKSFTYKVLKDDNEKKTTFEFGEFGHITSPKERNKILICKFIESKNDKVPRQNIIDYMKNETNGQLSDISVINYLKELVSEQILSQPNHGFYKSKQFQNIELEEVKK
ncbi:AAA family ATPase [Candidatus Pacearchaeota archaeon]|nr:AAA family ATPase [Candidatus Pacearchaeota archaeon]